MDLSLRNEELLKEAISSYIRTDKMHRSQFDNTVRSIGICRSQHMLLMHLSRSGTKPSQKELAEKLDVSPSAIAISLNKLENAGYIIRSVSKSDNRFNEIGITEKGLEIIEKTHRVFSFIDNRMFDGFSDDELEAIIKFNNRIAGNLKGLTEDCNQLLSGKEIQK